MRRAESALFELIATHAPIGIFMNDAAGQCVYVNRRCCEKLGLPAAQLMGTGWARALHPEDRERVLAAWHRRVKTGGRFELEYRFIRPDGSTLWVYGKASAIGARGGTASGYIGTLTDVTAHKTAELALAESRTRLQALLKERERLAQNLHDSCIQSIFAVGLSLEGALPLVARNPSRAAAAIRDAAASLKLVIQDLRTVISGPAVPEAGGGDFRGHQRRRELGRRRLRGLSSQERRILELVVEGRTNREIGAALNLSDKTVKNYLSNAFQKLQVRRRAHAAEIFRSAGAAR